MTDVFSDASCYAGQYAGAFIVGRGGEPEGVLLDNCRTSSQAELLTMIAAMKAAAGRDTGPMVVHTDIAQIVRVLARGRGAAKELAWLLSKTESRIAADAWNFPEYSLCHDRARAMAGIKGTQHPFLVQQQRKNANRELKGGLEV